MRPMRPPECRRSPERRGCANRCSSNGQFTAGTPRKSSGLPSVLARLRSSSLRTVQVSSGRPKMYRAISGAGRGKVLDVIRDEMRPGAEGVQQEGERTLLARGQRIPFGVLVMALRHDAARQAGGKLAQTCDDGRIERHDRDRAGVAHQDIGSRAAQAAYRRRIGFSTRSPAACVPRRDRTIRRASECGRWCP